MNTTLDTVSTLVSLSFVEALKAHAKCGESFSHHQLAVNDRTRLDCLVATLTVEGSQLNGFLELFLQTDCIDTRFLFDATELVNQIAGRLSNQLYQHGINVHLNPPSLTRCYLFEEKQNFDDRFIFLTTCLESTLCLKSVLGPASQLFSGQELEIQETKQYSLEGSLTLFEPTENDS